MFSTNNKNHKNLLTAIVTGGSEEVFILGCKTNYWDYMTTDPIDCEEELKRLPNADYELCTALFTMLLREDHFCNGALMRRCEEGHIDAILQRMIKTLGN